MNVFLATEVPAWQRLQAVLMHYALSTETAYIAWVERFMRFVGSEDLEQFGASELKDSLTDLE